jgi:hypothetical protein
MKKNTKNSQVKTLLVNDNIDSHFNPKRDIHFEIRLSILMNHASWLSFKIYSIPDDLLYQYLN